MENELTTILHTLQTRQNEVALNRAKTIYAICRSITPQFYARQTSEEMTAMVNTIQLLTQSIREDILTCMCNLAVKAYPGDKAKNPKVFFDINYILGFFNEAWETAREERGYNCFCGQNENRQLLYTTYDGFDWENNCAKTNAPIWIDERC